MSGRKAQAAQNDLLILAVARAVFVADPTAPIAAVAEQSGVGISALYRRYASKDDLLRKLCADGLALYNAVAEAALADDSDPWEAFATFMRLIVDADTHSLTLSLAGTFTPTEQLWAESQRSHELNVRLLKRTQAAGAVRADLVVDDLSFLFEQIAAVRLGDEQRTGELRHRYLALILDALRPPSATALPGPPPEWQEISSRWERIRSRREPNRSRQRRPPSS